mgnify:FL=1
MYSFKLRVKLIRSFFFKSEIKMKYLIILLTIIMTNQSYASIWHVSNNGLDANNGSEEQPFKTLNKALKIAQSGDKIYLFDFLNITN